MVKRARFTGQTAVEIRWRPKSEHAVMLAEGNLAAGLGSGFRQLLLEIQQHLNGKPFNNNCQQKTKKHPLEGSRTSLVLGFVSTDPSPQ